MSGFFYDHFNNLTIIKGLRLFGQTYSGLEYDYRGLLHVYEELHDNEKYTRFCDVLDEWRILRSDEERVSFKGERVTRRFFKPPFLSETHLC